MAERDSDHIQPGATTPADAPLEYWRAKFEIKDNVVVCAALARAKDFTSEERDGGRGTSATRYVGTEPGSPWKGAARRVKFGAGATSVSVEDIRFVLETGAWPDRYQQYSGKPWGGGIGSSPLGQMLAREAHAAGLSFDDLTVLHYSRDPFRLDRPAYHAMGHWVGEQFNRLVPGGRTIHWRGFHYVLVSAGGVIKPDGRPYENSLKVYTWLGEVASKAARWLGYVDMDRLTEPPPMTGPNGAKFDKMLRSELLRKSPSKDGRLSRADEDDDASRVLKRLAPTIAKTVDDIDMKFADILARLQKIEDAEEALSRQPSRILPPREPSGDEVLAMMRVMPPDQRAALLNKLKQ